MVGLIIEGKTCAFLGKINIDFFLYTGLYTIILLVL